MRFAKPADETKPAYLWEEETLHDGSCLGNDKEFWNVGLEVWFNEGHPENISKADEGKRENNAAELESVVAAISRTKESNIKKLRKHTDSQFLHYAYTHWLPRWKNNSWVTLRNQPIMNRLGFERSRELLLSFDLQWRYIMRRDSVILNSNINS